MKVIKYTILYCFCENFCDSIYYGSGLSISDPHLIAHTDPAPQKSGATPH
jgi:hypothetical protein